MIAPPRGVERLLEGLSANAAFRDAILGDLAEEFGRRVDRDGVFAARRWYYRESIRTAPHLVHDWARGLTGPDIRRSLNIICASYVFSIVLVFFMLLTLTTLLTGLGFSRETVGQTRIGPLMPTIGLAIAVVGSVFGGYIAAWLDDRTPLVSAIALGIVWSCVNVATSLTILHPHEELWYRVSVSVAYLGCATIGGSLKILADSRGLRNSTVRSP
jgi:hypothetical protein